MKLNKLNLLFCAFVLIQSFVAYSNTKNSKINLEIIGLGAENNLPEGVLVTLFKEDKQFGWISQGDLVYTESGFSLNLSANNNYIIKIKKKGYASRTYCFSTELNNTEAINNIKFSFDLNFFKYKTEMEENASDLFVSFTNNNSSSNSVNVNKF